MGEFDSPEALLSAYNVEKAKHGWAYFNTTDLVAYIWNNDTGKEQWDKLTMPGAKGPQGEQGMTGASVYIKGSLDNTSQLPANGGQTAGLADAYLIGGHLYVWDGSEWKDVGLIQGPAGPQGSTGPAGPQGDPGPGGPAGVGTYSLMFMANSDRYDDEIVSERKRAKFANGADIFIKSVATDDNDTPLAEALLPVPTRWGFTFEGWYLNTACTDGMKWNRVVTGDMTLYAKWDFVKMIKVNGGAYLQGNSAANAPANETPRAERRVSSFYIGQYLITQDQFERVTGRNPSSDLYGGKSGRKPVGSISWYDAVDFCNALSTFEGLDPVYTVTGRTPATGYPITNATVTVNWTANGYRLPTECEWEYAAKGGHLAQTGLSSDPYYIYAGSNILADVAWWRINTTDPLILQEVGQKAPNQLGIYDMSGSMFEWCWDWYSETYYSTDTTNNLDRKGPATGTQKIMRGGGFQSTVMAQLTICGRTMSEPNSNAVTRGIRFVRNAE